MQMLNVLTIDVEEWFHGMKYAPSRWSQLESRLQVGMEVILQLLDKHLVKATFFVLAPLARQYPCLMRQLVAAGHEIGTHGMWHRPIYTLTPATFHEELCTSIAILQSITGQRVVGHRAPYFSITDESLWAFDVLMEAGIIYDSSIFPVRNSRYGIPSASRRLHKLSNGLRELPIATWRILGQNLPTGGGFYGRFFPVSMLAAGIRQLNSIGQPAVIYFHPWEFDPAHPVVTGNLKRLYRFTHYHRLHATAAVLDKLLTDFPFGTARAAIQSSDHVDQRLPIRSSRVDHLANV